MTSNTVTRFDEFALPAMVIKALDEVGYETPSPIQSQTIPLLLAGNDVIGQAQTGTGKTAAFALPMLAQLDLNLKSPQGLVLVPTRELAIQVAEAFQKYARHIPGFHVLPIYGGHDYRSQIRGLTRGVHIVVGTPGRTMDHMRRGHLSLELLKTLVLDEADEMLRMGFINDVEWILEQIPSQRQIALFSATMPAQIRRIATRYLRNPSEITVKSKTATVDTIRQHYWMVSGVHKLDALTRILETAAFDAMLVFVRTKTMTGELSDKLEARGYACAALNGDISQRQREQVISQLKAGKLDVIVATDVAARGLDVNRISHVINYDMPYDTETYVHRIGRTGRAGREGDAILFVEPREKYLLTAIEKATRQKMDLMELPTSDIVNDKRIEKFKQRITDELATDTYQQFIALIEQYQQEQNVPALDIAAALARLVHGDAPFLLQEERRNQPQIQSDDRHRQKPHSKRSGPRATTPTKQQAQRTHPQDSAAEAMERYRIAVGRIHRVKPANIVGAIANEAGVDSQYIGRIQIYEDHSVVDLPVGMPKDIFNHLQNVRVAGQPLKIFRLSQDAEPLVLPVSQPRRDRGEDDKRRRAKTKPAKQHKAAARAGDNTRRKRTSSKRRKTRKT